MEGENFEGVAGGCGCGGGCVGLWVEEVRDQDREEVGEVVDAGAGGEVGYCPEGYGVERGD